MTVKEIFKKIRVIPIFVDKTIVAFVLNSLVKTKQKEDSVIIIHRVGSDTFQRTAKILRKSLKEEGWSVECDVVFTKDRVPVALHQKDISSIIGDNKKCVDTGKMTINDIKKLNIPLSRSGTGKKIMTLKEILGFLKNKVEVVYLHDKEENELGDVEKEKQRVNIFAEKIRSSGLKEKTIVMVESGNLSIWREVAPDIKLLKCWLDFSSKEKNKALEDYCIYSTKYVGVYHGIDQLNILGKTISRMGFYNLGAFLGFKIKKEDIESYIERGYSFVVFTINDKLLFKLYSNAGFQFIGTDYPLKMVSVKRVHKNIGHEAKKSKS